jgi:threonine/homoserine/homoserine lactone efflux protein
MVVQLTIATLGMTTIVEALAHAFAWLKWLGVIYLLYLAVSAFCAPAVDLATMKPQPRSMKSIYLHGLLVSLTNPKTLLFYSVFLPQFMNRDADILPQFLLLSVTFVVIAVALDSLWAILSAKAHALLALSGRLRNRLTGGFYLCAGIGLALARKP